MFEVVIIFLTLGLLCQKDCKEKCCLYFSSHILYHNVAKTKKDKKKSLNSIKLLAPYVLV